MSGTAPSVNQNRRTVWARRRVRRLGRIARELGYRVMFMIVGGFALGGGAMSILYAPMLKLARKQTDLELSALLDAGCLDIVPRFRNH